MPLGTRRRPNTDGANRLGPDHGISDHWRCRDVGKSSSLTVNFQPWGSTRFHVMISAGSHTSWSRLCSRVTQAWKSQPPLRAGVAIIAA